MAAGVARGVTVLRRIVSDKESDCMGRQSLDCVSLLTPTWKSGLKTVDTRLCAAVRCLSRRFSYSGRSHRTLVLLRSSAPKR
jgi:hypothetical protein